jgi:hypothetical protein
VEHGLRARQSELPGRSIAAGRLLVGDRLAASRLELLELEAGIVPCATIASVTGQLLTLAAHKDVVSTLTRNVVVGWKASDLVVQIVSGNRVRESDPSMFSTHLSLSLPSLVF